MFGIGGPELVLIIIVLLIFVGPDKLPEVARTVGTGLRDLRRAANLAQSELKQGMEELTREVDGVTRDVRNVVDQASREVPEPVSRPAPTAVAAPAPTSAESVFQQAHAVPDEYAAPDAPATPPPPVAAESPHADPPADAPAPPRPTFNRPTAAPLPGTMARAVSVVAAPPAAVVAAPDHPPGVAAASEPASEPVPEPEPEPSERPA